MIRVAFLVAALNLFPSLLCAQGDFTIERILSRAFCYELVSARNADRIAWLANERGRRARGHRVSG
jgi:hypothetical protein